MLVNERLSHSSSPCSHRFWDVSGSGTGAESGAPRAVFAYTEAGTKTDHGCQTSNTQSEERAQRVGRGECIQNPNKWVKKGKIH